MSPSMAWSSRPVLARNGKRPRTASTVPSPIEAGSSCRSSHAPTPAAFTSATSSGVGPNVARFSRCTTGSRPRRKAGVAAPAPPPAGGGGEAVGDGPGVPGAPGVPGVVGMVVGVPVAVGAVVGPPVIGGRVVGATAVAVAVGIAPPPPPGPPNEQPAAVSPKAASEPNSPRRLAVPAVVRGPSCGAASCGVRGSTS
ncbi:hypothetical protein FRAHR75_50028 [Frankia sp. Hr75.2]|nr:hypothetical protein FRAHR75_50028 [Frankia sp. Hr75.2]